jgi:hypothetical protein
MLRSRNRTTASGLKEPGLVGCWGRDGEVWNGFAWRWREWRRGLYSRGAGRRRRQGNPSCTARGAATPPPRPPPQAAAMRGRTPGTPPQQSRFTGRVDRAERAGRVAPAERIPWARRNTRREGGRRWGPGWQRATCRSPLSFSSPLGQIAWFASAQWGTKRTDGRTDGEKQRHLENSGICGRRQKKLLERENCPDSSGRRCR